MFILWTVSFFDREIKAWADIFYKDLEHLRESYEIDFSIDYEDDELSICFPEAVNLEEILNALGTCVSAFSHSSVAAIKIL